MQPPIDLTQTFRREMLARQRKTIASNLVDFAAWIGAFLFGLLVMTALGVLVATLSGSSAVIFIGITVIAFWGAWGALRLFFK